LNLPTSGNPTLAYLYRRFLANRLLKGIAPGRFLEIGVGSGRFYQDLTSRGFSGLCVDLNTELILEHQQHVNLRKGQVKFQVQNFFSLSERFDLLVAFEVLEHYEEDLTCLKQWSELLRPGGTLLFSVPAHMRQWTENDTRAGHARRYEKAEVREKLRVTGFAIEQLWCYGFPILNLTYPLSSNLGPSLEPIPRSDPLMPNCGKTCISGMRRFAFLSKALFHGWLWTPVLFAQLLTKDFNLGTGYVVRCSKALE
jgi:SAM-dependent methyltransferase